MTTDSQAFCHLRDDDPAATSTEEMPAGFEAPAVEDLALRFSQFEILEHIGNGGMRAVYNARQPTLKQFVAVKILPPHVADDPTFAERFTREAKTLARLSHPHIVTVHDVGREGDLYYFVMEYVDGVNLREIIRRLHTRLMRLPRNKLIG